MRLRGFIVATLFGAVLLPSIIGVIALSTTPPESAPERYPTELARMTARLLMQDLSSTSQALDLGIELFDLPALEPEVKTGVLRMLYKQDPSLNVLVLLDGEDQASVEPVFLRTEQIEQTGPESKRLAMDESSLGRYLKHLPIATARGSGRALSDVYVDKQRNTALLAGAIAVPTGGDSKPWLLGFERSLRQAQQSLTAGGAAGGTRIFVVDDGGRLVIHPDGNRVLERDSMADHVLVASFLKGKRSGRAVWTSDGSHGPSETVVGAFQKLDFHDWAVVVEQVKSPIPASSPPIWAFLAWGLVLCLVGAGSIAIGRALQRSLDEAVSVASSYEDREADMKRIQAALLETRKLNAIGDLGAGVAHEFNNPLGGILGLTQLLLRKKADDDPDRNFLARIEEEAKRCKSITDNLLRFSEQQDSEHKEPVRLEWVLDKAIDMIDSRLEHERIEIVREYTETPKILGNEGKLQRAFLNIFMNSETAMPDGGQLTISTALEKETVVVRVADTGRGIAPENLGRVFEPFFTTKDNWKGAGLGLWVVYQILQEHGGSLGVESDEQKGTVVSFRIPVADASGSKNVV